MKRQDEINKLFKECLKGDPFPLVHYCRTKMPRYGLDRLIEVGSRRFHLPELKLWETVEKVWGDEVNRHIV